MEIIRKISKTDTTNKMTVAFDVSKDKLNYYSEIQGKLSGNNCRETQAIQGVCKNTPNQIKKTLSTLDRYSAEAGYNAIHVVCEPTGIYSNALMQTAHSLEYTTAYISGESVHKAKVIENHDSGKDDVKDPRVIFMLSKMGKELVYRTLPAKYQQLRELNRLYDAADLRRTEMRCETHHLIIRLFCDYPMSKDFIFTKSGDALIKHYNCNPYRIVEDSYKEFCSKLTKESGVRKDTLEKLYAHANGSVLHDISIEELTIIEQRLHYVQEDYKQAESRKSEIRKQIEDIYYDLLETEKIIPIADGKVFNAFHIGRILGETGPMKDFNHWKTLFKYGGLNLRKKESGYFKGKLKLSKKGRIHLRGVLGKLVFRLVKKSEIFGEYYHKRKKEEHIPGTKLMANVERKLLKMIFGMAKRCEAFNSERFFKCESQYKLAA